LQELLIKLPSTSQRHLISNKIPQYFPLIVSPWFYKVAAFNRDLRVKKVSVVSSHASCRASFLGASAKSQKKLLLASSCLPVRLSAWKNSTPTQRIFMKFDI
jgi:hypothetical protein